MGILKEVALGVLGVILTVFFEFITLGLVEPEKFTAAVETWVKLLPSSLFNSIS